MVLTCSMATTYNNQGDEPHTTTLERQVQTLVPVVERLTKENHELEEQLRQNNARLTLRRRTKKVQALREKTKKGWRVATPQADKSDKTQAVHPPWIWLHTHGRRNADDKGMDGLHDERPQKTSV